MQNLVRCSKYRKQPTKNIYQDYIGPNYEGKTDKNVNIAYEEIKS